MGLSQFNYITSWIFYFILNGLLVTLVMMLIMKFFVFGLDSSDAYIKEGYNFAHIVFIFGLYCISNIGFIMLLTTFFSKAKTATQVINVFILGCYFYSTNY